MILTLVGRTPRIAASAYIAPSADVIGSVDVGENSSVESNRTNPVCEGNA